MTHLNPIAAAAGIAFLAIASLTAQEVTEFTSSDPASSASGSGIQEKISETVSGIVSGEISAAQKGVELDNFLQQTFMRISDCWTLCRQEMLLAREAAKQEAIQTAKDIFRKRDKDDGDPENTRKSILDRLPPLNLDDSDTVRQAVEDVALNLVKDTISGTDGASQAAAAASVASPAQDGGEN